MSTSQNAPNDDSNETGLLYSIVGCSPEGFKRAVKLLPTADLLRSEPHRIIYAEMLARHQAGDDPRHAGAIHITLLQRGDIEDRVDRLCLRLRTIRPRDESSYTYDVRDVLHFARAVVAQQAEQTKTAAVRSLVLQPVGAIAAERIAWLLDGYVALGEVNVLAGSGGSGKTMLALDIAVRVAGGLPMPSGARCGLSAPAGVLYITSENHPAKVLRPRIEATALRLTGETGGDRTRADAILNRVFVQRGVVTLPDGSPTTADPDAAAQQAEVAADPEALVLPRDIPLLRDAVQQQGVRLVVIDPVVSFADTSLDVFSPSHMRHLLDPLAVLAQDENLALWAVVHFSKTAGVSVVLRVSMSRQVSDTARAVSVVLEDPRPGSDYEALRWLAMAKNNLGSKPPAASYRICSTTHPSFEEETVAVVEWTGDTRSGTADALEQALEEEAKALRSKASDPYGAGGVRGPRAKDAVRVLGEKLHALRDRGDVVVTSQELEEWRLAEGISPETWTKAREHLGVKTTPTTVGGFWTQDLADLEWLQKLPSQEDMAKMGAGYSDPTQFGPPTPHKPGTPGGTKTP